MKYDIIVLGSGPGGYVTAIRASQLGFKVAVIEKENLGGVCLNWGCIPTKALLKSAQVFDYLKHAADYGLKVDNVDKDFNAVVARSRNVAGGMSKGVQFLMKKNKIDVIDGFGKVKPGKKIDVTAADGKVTEYSADNIIIATGARSRELPNLPQDGVKVIGYRQAMTLPTQPKSMIIVGSGAIGVEFAHFYNAMGTQVTIVEFMPNIVPVEDEDISKQMERSMKKAGVTIMTNSSVEKIDTTGKGVKATVKTAKGEEVIEADILLSAVGIKTNIENIGLEEVGIVELMKKTNAIIGGEGNGGIIYPELHYGRDSLVGVALFLTYLAGQDKTVAELRASYPQYYMSKNKIELTPQIDVDAILESLTQTYKDDHISTIDGVKIDFATEWVHLRKSNTEPIIRIYTEAPTQQEADVLAERFVKELKVIAGI